MNFISNLTRGALLLGIVSLTLLGAPISGTLNITGSASVSLTNIDFLPPGAAPGVFVVDFFTQTGSFVPLAGTAGVIQDLDSALYPTGAAISLMNWMTFAADPTLSFELTLIQPGSFLPGQCFLAPAAGQTCSLPGSPFNLSNSTGASGLNSTVSFGVEGLVHSPQSADPSSFSGTFSTQFTGQPYQELLAVINAGGSVTATYSANFSVVPIPEPATLALCGSALIGLALVRRRKS